MYKGRGRGDSVLRGNGILGLRERKGRYTLPRNDINKK